MRHSFSRINGVMALTVFAIAATVYLLTVEPTASLWDCPEFIACGYKLEVGHAPGAPVFMLAANLASMLAGSPSEAALMVNRLSALLSAGCIALLFLTITHLCRRLLCGGRLPDVRRTIVIETAGLAGAMAYMFSDTFWFSAVEGEVYAFSSFLTALMFWLILRWEEEADSATADRWLVLIAYITGVSLGVHLLCLLCLPAMALVFHFRRCGSASAAGALKALCAGFALIALVLYAIVPGITWAGGRMELLFVNVLRLPFHSGLLCLSALIAASLAVSIARARRRAVRTALLCLAMTLSGYSSYAVIMIRSAANPPINENCPDNIFALARYLGREQYGAPPLLYGPAYTAQPELETAGDGLMKVRTDTGSAVISPDEETGRYEVVRHREEVRYKQNMVFPRMHSRQHAAAYESWMRGVDKGHDGQPTALENLRFFLTYQVGFMYWRYFMWNFVGRQNNIQGHGEPEHGNWITGIKPVDDFLLQCDTAMMPSDLRCNKGHNVFYGMPLLLGLAGLAWQLRSGRRGRRQAAVTGMLFVMTGLAIVVYLNQTPVQARERDYAYAGSFYAFAIWIGMGAAAVCEAAYRTVRQRTTAAAMAAALACMAVPLQMAGQTWDDHDRSGRTACRDFGRNYLESTCREGNPILITYGDNDTFPLWYNQEVEGVRTDVRVCNLAYAQTDWYIDQMKCPSYDSPPLPVGWPHEYYAEGNNEYVRVGVDSIVAGIGDRRMTVDLQGTEALMKSDLFILQMLDNILRDTAAVTRPVYITLGMGQDILPYLRDHLVLEGLAYRVVPGRCRDAADTERLYNNVMHRFRYGNLSAEGIYVDEDTRRMAVHHQIIMGLLIDSLLSGDDTERALAVARKWQRELPPGNVPYTGAAISMARCLYVCGLADEGDGVADNLLSRADEWLAFGLTARTRGGRPSGHSRRWLPVMHDALLLAEEHGRRNLINTYYDKFIRYAQEYSK